MYNIWMRASERERKDKDNDNDNDNDKRLFEPTDERRRNVT